MPVILRGLESLKRSLGSITNDVLGPMKPGSERQGYATDSANMIADSIRSRAPRGKTGNLKRSIIAKPYRKKGQSEAFVGIDYRYGPHAHLLEYGTVNMSPKPFWRPGVSASESAAMDSLTRDIERMIDRAWS